MRIYARETHGPPPPHEPVTPASLAQFSGTVKRVGGSGVKDSGFDLSSEIPDPSVEMLARSSCPPLPLIKRLRDDGRREGVPAFRRLSGLSRAHTGVLQLRLAPDVNFVPQGRRVFNTPGLGRE